MRFTTLTVVALVLLLAGTASAGKIVMTNGDVVSGEVLRSEGQSLVVKTVHLGTVRVPITAIARLETDGVFTVQLTSGDRLTGLVLPDGDGAVKVRSASGAYATPLADVTAMTPAPVNLAFPDGIEEAIEQAVEAEWRGDAELGLNYSSGNTDRRGLAVRLGVVRDAPNDIFEVRAGAIYAEADGERDTNEQYLTVQESLKMHPWYVFGFLGFSRDEFKDIDLRGTLIPGVGYIFADTADWKLKAEVGPSLTYTDWRYDDSEYVLELMLGADAEMAVLDHARLFESFKIFPAISDTPNFRAISETGFEQPLSESLFFRLTFLYQYDSTVQRDRKRTDIKVLMSLALKF
jgi:putative salt-induced outer membrane protein YdiY